MCGIISASSNDNIDFSSIKLGMLSADDRGGHSCGIAVRGERETIIKEVNNARSFVNDKRDNFQIPRENNTFIGHTRYATQGDKNFTNTHPFRFGNLSGVHNGSIDNFKQLKSRYINKYRNDVEDWYGDDWKEKFDVDSKNEIKLESDSRLLYYMIWKEGIKEALPKLKGTMGLVYYAREQGEEYLYFYRWDKPLCYGYRDGELWIGSLKKYLDTLGCTNIKNVTEHAVYKVKDGTIITSKQLPDDAKPKVKSSYRDDDFDEELEPEKKKKKTTTSTTNKDRKSYGQTGHGGFLSGNDDGQEGNSGKDRDFEFIAPKHAKGYENNDGELCLYWFSGVDPDVIFIETEGEVEVEHFDLGYRQKRIDFRAKYPSFAEYALDDYDDIQLAIEYRDEVEQTTN